MLGRSLSRVGSNAQTLTRLEGQVWSVSVGNCFVTVETIRALQEGSIIEGRALYLLEITQEVARQHGLRYQAALRLMDRGGRCVGLHGLSQADVATRS